MRQYIVQVDSSTSSTTNVTYTTCNIFTLFVARIYRFLKGWSKPRILGSYVPKSVRD